MYIVHCHTATGCTTVAHAGAAAQRPLVELFLSLRVAGVGLYLQKIL